jgi:SAM-dependent methyltransferase
MWDERYRGPDYAYGTEPNDFLVATADQLPAGRVLCLGEGEGRNAVWLAGRGLEVTAVDASGVGLEKARRLAAERGVAVDTVHADLATFTLEPGAWDAVVSIFCHLPPALRADVHRRAVAGLRPGGVLLLEAYTPRQLDLGTGGPPVAELMMDADTLRAELAGLDFLHLEELERDIREGAFHAGVGAVVQVLGRKPVEP